MGQTGENQADFPLLLILKCIKEQGWTVPQFFLAIFQPHAQTASVAAIAYRFIRDRQHLAVLGLWSNISDGDATLDQFAMERVQNITRREIRSVVRSNAFKLEAKALNDSALEEFSYQNEFQLAELHMPLTTRILEQITDCSHHQGAASTIPRDETCSDCNEPDCDHCDGSTQKQTDDVHPSSGGDNSSNVNARRKNAIIVTALCSMLRFRHRRSVARLALFQGFYLWASGAHKSTIVLCNQLGISASYDTIANACVSLSDTNLHALQAEVSSGNVAFCYDNIHLPLTHRHERTSNVQQFQAGITMTAYPLPTPVYLGDGHSKRTTSQLFLSDISPTPDDHKYFKSVIKRHLLLLLLSFAPDLRDPAKRITGEGWPLQQKLTKPKQLTFQERIKRDQELERLTRPARPHPAAYKTQYRPLRTKKIDQATRKGNMTAVRDMLSQCSIGTENLDTSNIVIPIFGDTLTVERLRSIKNLMDDEVSRTLRFEHIIPVPSLFHISMAFLGWILKTFRGSEENSGPGSLYGATVVMHRQIKFEKNFDYYKSRELVVNMATAQTALLMAAKLGVETRNIAHKHKKTLPILLVEKQPSTEDLDTAAEQVVNEILHANDLGEDRADVTTPRRHSLLLLQWTLVHMELVDCIKFGDWSRTLQILDWILLAFASGSNYKMTNEILHLKNNIKNVWSPSLSATVGRLSFVNLSGKVGKCQPIDLFQEHLNLFNKLALARTSANKDYQWDLLEKRIAPNAASIATFKAHILADLGQFIDVKHTVPNVNTDVNVLVRWLANEKALDASLRGTGNMLVPDAIGDGIGNLAGKRLDDFNARISNATRRSNDVNLTEIEGHRGEEGQAPGMLDSLESLDSQQEEVSLEIGNMIGEIGDENTQAYLMQCMDFS